MPTRDRPTVLVVEDETLIRMYGAEILEEAGFNVLEAETADEAIALLNQHNDIQLLFSDIDMPGSMNGLELANVVRQRWPSISLLLTSGHHNVDDASLPDAGRFVRKPWTQASLMEKIEKAMSSTL